jgi:carbonic anhydrase
MTQTARNFEISCSCCGNAPHLPGRGMASRRGFIATGLAAGVAAAGSAMLPRRAWAQTTLSPDAALQALIDGNKRFVQKHLTSFGVDLAALRKNTADKQEPFASVLSCADSRVPVELVFDQSIGQLFVTRVAGNLATPEIIASLEYGAAVLGTKTILVLGHSSCGAVKSAIAGTAVPGQISALFSMIRPAVEQSGGDLETAIKDNAKIHAHILATASPLLAGLIKDGKLKIAAGYYALDTGQVTILS